jgi:hypothetical protein
MSLINDALKRAQEAQKKSPAPLAGAPLHAVPAQHNKTLWIIVAFVAGVLFFGALGLFFGLRTNHLASPTTLPKREIQNVNVQPAIEKPPAVVPVTNVPSSVVSTAIPIATPDSTPVLNQTTTTSANETPLPRATTPKIKLQAIFYRPKNPSVVINGKTLFVGEEVAGAKVVAITIKSVTIISSGETNVLTLE